MLSISLFRLFFLNENVSDKLILLKLITAILISLELMSYVIIRIKVSKIMEMYSEIESDYRRLYSGGSPGAPEAYHRCHNCYITSLTCLAFILVAYSSLLTSLISNPLIDQVLSLEPLVGSGFGSQWSLPIVHFRSHGPLFVFYLNCWANVMGHIYYELNIRYLYVLEVYNKKLKTFNIKPSYYKLLEIKYSLKCLKISEHNLQANVGFIKYFIAALLVFYDLTVWLFLKNGDQISWIMKTTICVYLLATHSISLIDYLHVWTKTRNKIDIEKRLKSWDY